MLLSPSQSSSEAGHTGESVLPRSLLLLAVMGIVLRLVAHHLNGHLFIDDTYIYLRYADNFSSGLGLVYNEGEMVMGFTSPLYMLLLAGLAALLPTPTLIASLPWLGILCYLVGLWWLWRILLSFSRQIALVGATVFTVWFAFVDSSVQGMETPLFLMGILGMWHAHVTERSVARGFWAGVTGLTRPEGVFLLAILLIVAAVRRLRTAVVSAGIAVAMGAVWAATAITFYGSVLPNSAKAKASTSVNAVDSFFDLSLYLGSLCLGLPDTVFLKLGTAVTSVLGAGLIVVLAWLAWRHVRNPRSLGFIVLLSLMAYIAFYLIGHPGRLFSWYGVPSCLCFLVLLSLNIPRAVPGLLSRRPVLAALLVGLVLVSMGLQHFRSARIRESVGGRYQRVAEWLQSNTAPDDVVATGDIGLIGWVSQRPVLDLGALVSSELARAHAESASVFLGDLMDWYGPRVFILDHPVEGSVILEEDFIHYDLFRDASQRRRWEALYELRQDSQGMGKSVYLAREGGEMDGG